MSWLSISRGRPKTDQARPALVCAWQMEWTEESEWVAMEELGGRTESDGGITYHLV